MLKLFKRKKTEQFVDYSTGSEGFIKWCEDFCYIKIYVNGMAKWCRIGCLPTEINPSTGRSSNDMWIEQKRIAREALVMKDGRFKHRLIVLCWMRGEGKSLFVCLIQLWKFFNFPSQQIMLGANSKDQVKFVHFDIMRDIILNSPPLVKIVGRRNVQEKEVKLRNRLGNTVSIIRSISSFSGIVSNITGYTFSEIFDMKNPKFFTQLDGSIRNIPNALGVIDSTVSAKEHILYNLFDTYRKGLDPSLYFSHRESRKGSSKDYTNPEMTQEQLDSYRNKFPAREFAMYFKNTWDAGARKMFPESVIAASRYIGIDNNIGEVTKVLNICDDYYTVKEEQKGVIESDDKASLALDRLIPISKVYKLTTSFNQPRSITIDELERLSEIYDTHFALCVGVDRADPMKADITIGARTVVTLVAKGLPGSKSNPSIALHEDSSVQRFVYFLLDVKHIIQSDIDTIKDTVEKYIIDYDGIETLCTERWGMWDIGEWCEENSIIFDPISPTYGTQREGFAEMYNLLMTGRLKLPITCVPGTKGTDLLTEELLMFDHDPLTKFYGSPEKKEKYGVQDDSVFSLNWSIYGGRFLTVDDLRVRKVQTILAQFYEDKSTLVGKY